MNITIIEKGLSRSVSAEKGTLISDILDIHDFKIDYPCAKKGICKKCLVKVFGDISEVSKAEIALGDKLNEGYRLACCTKILGDATIELPNQDENINTSENEISAENLNKNPLFKDWGLAVDIGTTTIAASLISSENHVFTKSLKNPQIEFGADVISRIEQALAGKESELSSAVVDGINEIIDSLCITANINCEQIDYLVITGNTVMQHLLTNKDCSPLSKAPFEAEFLAGITYNATDFGFKSNEKAKVYLPNCFAAFVGADITTAILASGMRNSQKTSILVDIGTNGEMALWHENKLSCCSTAAGPAFEGVGVKSGMHGVTGAIDHVEYIDGDFKVSTIGDKKALGICGSGVIDCIACMLESEAMDETGRIDDENDDFEDRIVETDDDTMFEFSNNIGIYGKDIRAIQLAKSAICSGLETLMEVNNLLAIDIDTLYIAGGFGSFIDIEKAGVIGLIPSELTSKVKVIGNAALTGAQMILLDKNHIDTAKEICSDFNLIDLASSKIFMDKYIENMFF